MRDRPPFSPSRHAQGLQLYRTGASIADLIRTVQDVERMHEQPGLTNEQHDEIAAASPSLCAGFADGALDDIRLIATGQRRGVRA